MKGLKEYERFKRGESLTHKQAILAQCYVCNGLDEGGDDCNGEDCPLYQFMPYGAGKRKRATLSDEQKRAIADRLKNGRKRTEANSQN